MDSGAHVAHRVRCFKKRFSIVKGGVAPAVRSKPIGCLRRAVGGRMAMAVSPPAWLPFYVVKTRNTPSQNPARALRVEEEFHEIINVHVNMTKKNLAKPS